MDPDRIAERLTDEVRRRLIDAGMPAEEAARWHVTEVERFHVTVDRQQDGPNVAGEAPTDNDR